MNATAPVLKAREAGPYSRHIPSLDGLRGLAILGVMASHLFPGNHTGPPFIRAVESLFPFGASGVDLFFVLSGFLITGILYDSLSDRHFFRKFYARRTLRIFPLYYGVLIGAFLLTPWLGIVWHHMFWSLALYLQNTTLIGKPLSAFHAGPITFTHFWSLAIEEQFYLVWPLCVFFLGDRRRLLWVCAGLSVISIMLRFGLTLSHASYESVYGGTICRSDSLLMGAALALMLRGKHHDAVLRAGRWIFLGAAACFAVRLALIKTLQLQEYGTHGALGAASYTLGYTILAFAAAGLITWCLVPSWPQRFFQGKVLCFFGKYSYGLYIWHELLLPTLLPISREEMRNITTNKGLGVAGAGLIVLGLSVVIAYASYHLYEKHFLKLKRFFNYEQPTVAARVPKVDVVSS
jgi:peptidoglycan/LPS O-acetylase OafA/YrhL